MKRKVIAETEFEDDDERTPEEMLSDAYDNDEFFEIENSVAYELGLYLDFSTVRGDYGTVFIFSDPDHEEDFDTWMGSDDAELAEMPFGEYAYNVSENVLSHDKAEWEDLYRKWIKSVIE